MQTLRQQHEKLRLNIVKSQLIRTSSKMTFNSIFTSEPKVTSPQNLSDLRPISVTPILSRLVEKLIARKYLTPALPTKLLEDQYAYRPTGSTIAALVDITHHITLMLETNTYVRCIPIDYSKAFDTINHEILFAKTSHAFHTSTDKTMDHEFPHR